MLFRYRVSSVKRKKSGNSGNPFFKPFFFLTRMARQTVFGQNPILMTYALNITEQNIKYIEMCFQQNLKQFETKYLLVHIFILIRVHTY